ncbi:GNAT family N-acetyltransferase [Cochlodiniinecator piscidefendens]|uniref:GNAT family N-acetyltransferase n=1 Tax=Cochlodiniinecator piscidefendens TaxID=2715756 RepID=UPI001409E046|nr:GNAT family N-acetyltransferase [Cochlodiniinecator piscidefendens]
MTDKPKIVQVTHAPTIRSANPSDLEALLDLYQHLNPGDERCPPDLAQVSFENLLQNAGSDIVLCDVDGVLVASCVLVVIPNLTRGGAPYGLIENVVTHNEYRGRGLGTLVLNAATEQAWKNNCYKVMLMTGSQKQSTLIFYENAGFEPSKTGFQKRKINKRTD